MNYIVAYDIEKDRTRNKVAKLMESYGIRLQKSVFECKITKKELSELILGLENLINIKKDSVIIIPNCKTCIAKRQYIGISYSEQIISVIDV